MNDLAALVSVIFSDLGLLLSGAFLVSYHAALDRRTIGFSKLPGFLAKSGQEGQWNVRSMLSTSPPNLPASCYIFVCVVCVCFCVTEVSVSIVSVKDLAGVFRIHSVGVVSL